MKRIGVVGGGASGMMAAIAAKNNDTEVFLFEMNDRVGKKILATGNGKCNFSNIFLDTSCYNGGDTGLVMKVINKFDSEALKDYFHSLGILSTVKRDGLYPISGQASTVLDCLRNELAYRGIEVLTGFEIRDIKPLDHGFKLSGKTEGRDKCFTLDFVILSIGSIASLKGRDPQKHYDPVIKLNIPFVETLPSLVQLRCSDGCLKALAGVRFDGTVSVMDKDKIFFCEKGEVQITDYGLSGIPTFQLSGKTAKLLKKGMKLQASLDFLPDVTLKELEEDLFGRKLSKKDRNCEDFFLGLANKKIMLQIMKQINVRPLDNEACLDRDRLQKAAHLLKDFRLNITDTNGFENAQVCSGGIDMSCIDENLMIRSIPGLYVTGELLDVDGRCGGYNLQWAFSSGYVAGKAAGKCC